MRVAYINRAGAYEKKKQDELALRDYETAVALFPEWNVAHRKHAEFFLERGRRAEAISSLTRAIDLNPNDGTRWAERAEAFESLGEPERAIADYTEALKRPGNRPTWLAARAKLQRARGDNLAALADLNEAIAEVPRSSSFHRQRAEVHRAMGNPEAADWPTGGQFVLFLALGLLMSWVKMLAGIVAALAIRNDWASAGLAVAIALLEDLWPVLDIILMAEGYVLIRILMSAGAVLAWWALGRGLRRIVQLPAVPLTGGGT